MPECRIEFLSSAWRDLDEISDYHLRMVGVSSAQQITDEILDKISLLAEFPHMAPLHPDPELAAMGYRKFVLTQTYVAVYRVVDHVVLIYRIVNGAVDYPRLLK